MYIYIYYIIYSIDIIKSSIDLYFKLKNDNILGQKELNTLRLLLTNV